MATATAGSVRCEGERIARPNLQNRFAPTRLGRQALRRVKSELSDAEPESWASSSHFRMLFSALSSLKGGIDFRPRRALI